jgi:uncharacterized coiled-coil protein SlyX
MTTEQRIADLEQNIGSLKTALEEILDFVGSEARARTELSMQIDALIETLPEQQAGAYMAALLKVRREGRVQAMSQAVLELQALL